MINNQWYAIASSDLLKPGKLTGLRRFGKGPDGEGKTSLIWHIKTEINT